MTKLISAAAMLAIAAGANATVIYSTGFENPPFAVAALSGQGTPAYAVTSTNFNVNNGAGLAHSGTQYARISGSGTSTSGSWAWADNTRTAAQLASGGMIIRASIWVNLSTTGAIGTRLYRAGLDLYNDTGASRVGAVGINLDGSVSFINGAATNASVSTAAGAVALNAWHNLIVEADFAAHTLAFTVDGVAITTPAGFGVFDAGITGFGDADLYSVRGSTGTNTTTEHRYDDLSIEQIPAPGALALVGLGGLIAARRRRA
ncbi:MAG: PEP-CTERM sorting domain-containing protein [Phycisphaerales bacterium]